ncbi:mechanosensitive ion channel family protein [Paracoccus sp. (in: a-proteobacteria)]|uniref:mechanosensitive ion channel family protein n=1 Tax=Paracoccus sp. TaxID=267 RepID=UPI00289E53CB|nr:mechanosensitive ion channel family protein [Paracoccus sp. (in: a-proteobacteria)]
MTNTTSRTRWRVLIPATLSLTVFIFIAILASPLHELMGERLKVILTTDLIRQVAGSLSLFAGARLIMLFLRQRLQIRNKGQRPVPKVVLDVLSTVIYTLVAIVSLSLFLRDDLSGLLTGSGLVLAVLGFAIRNVVADVFSGLALSIEAPFRIADWVQIDTLGRGRVVEIGWRTSRLVTRDSTYIILPNSQISRQKITNFSAPREEYRDAIEMTLPAEISVSDARNLIKLALRGVRSLIADRKTDIHVLRYSPQGITYQVKYWVPRHDRETDCRNEVFIAIDRVLRERGIRIAMAPPSPLPEVDAKEEPASD